MPWLLFAQPYDEALPGIRSLYFSDVGFTTTPAESPANTYWDRRIEVPLVVTQSLFAGSNAGGRSEISFGQIVLENQDGELDALIGYDWDGRLIEVRYTAIERPVLSDFAVVFSGTAEQITAGDEIQIQVRDLQLLLDEPYQTARFLGTGGVEGPAEYKDRKKPRLMGVRRQVTPILLNQPAQVYCYSDGPVGGPTAVLDQGVALTFSSNFATYALLTAATVTAGSYATCNALGLIRLGVAPTGIITIDAEGANTGGTVFKRFADIAQFVITSATTLVSGDFESGTISALNTLCPQTLGHWYDGGSIELSVRAVLDELAQSVGAYYGFNTSRKLILGRMGAPAVTEDFSYNDRDFLNIAPVSTDRRLKTQIVRWGKRENPLQDQDIAGSVTTGRGALIEQWRQERFTSSTVATASLLSREETLESALDNSTDALAEATRLVNLHGTKRTAFSLTIKFEAGMAPGKTAKLTSTRFGLSAGKNFLVLKVERQASLDETTIEVWG